MGRARVKVGAVLLVAAAVAAVPAPPAGAETRRVERILVLSVPHVAWSDLGQGDTPRLDALLDDAAIANLAVRGVRRRTTAGEGYATVSAGTRAGAPRGVDGVALGPGEPYEGGTAAEAFRRRTGRPASGAAVQLSVAGYHAENDRLLFGGEVGALGAALGRGRVSAAVVANADRAPTGLDPTRYGRQAATALMGPGGTLPGGRVDPGLLRPDPDAPWGHRLDLEAVTSAFDAAWRDRSVVLVEASDVARADAYAELAGSVRRPQLLRDALRRTDEVVGALLSRVDPERHALMVVGPATPRAQARLTLAALSAPGQEPALLRSASTRRSGFVVLADVAPTILDLLGVERPSAMEGRPMAAGARGGDAAARRQYLIDTDTDARFRDRLVTPLGLGFVFAHLALSLLAVAVLVRRPGRGRGVLEIAALWLMFTLPLTYLAGLFPFSDLGVLAYTVFVVGGAMALALGVRLLGRGRNRDDGLGDLLPVGVALTVIVAVIAGSAVTGSRLQLNTVFGDSPIVAGRFSGINNVTFAQLVSATLLLCAFGARQLAGRRRTVFVLALLTGALVVDGLPSFGADVGGVLAAGPAFVLTAVLLLGARVGPRTVALGVAGTAVAMGAFSLFDLARPSSQRSHLGRLLEQIDADGWGAFTQVVERKLDANLSVLTRSPWTLMVPAALAFVAYLVYRSPSALGAIQRRVPQLRAALAGLLLAGILGFALNDSGIAVPGMMFGVINPVLVYLSARWT
ncbi:MAG: hypothetical protein ACRD0O_04020 [Acidimicrobiia bacterium]